ncbi:hypothetical protein MSG28_013167 [Choristoneura fumiferana]|uniref:Uncharacterized protein n=1 Tax=Choristoneura fumiferana TaxID=7141 RepID=A0ACC0KST3_CHOFU|nr:hypothetical protein MSG28_013167 [Choristoneura fumiferana]
MWTNYVQIRALSRHVGLTPGGRTAARAYLHYIARLRSRRTARLARHRPTHILCFPTNKCSRTVTTKNQVSVQQ